ncbi:MAG: 4Fe-4S dicluster domain-containing protein [Candidatus Bathyarchaeota archaeon]|nr:MAG: 4Fe-4S dicluster domain-containing protein [Candidatus Bathyarchaeota archaeon]
MIAEEQAAAKKFLSVNPEKCVGCSICEFACSWEKENKLNPLKSRIRILRGPPFIHLATTCRQCEDTPCIRACPEDALYQSKETGAILVDNKKCNGCMWCLEACEYGTIRYDKDIETVVICDLCDGDPKCKEMCPEEAIDFVAEESEIVKAWVAASKKWIDASEKLVKMAKGNGVADFLADSKEIMERIDEKYKELFAKKK